MLRLDLICLTNSGISAARITSVRPTIDSTQAAPLSAGKTWLRTALCQPISTAEMAK